MDNVTHTLSALILNRMGLGAGSREGTLALVVGSNIPDVDMLIQLAGHFRPDSVFSHRGITHGLASVPVEVAFVSTSVWALARLTSRTKSAVLSWWKLALLSLLALLVHLALDFTNDYGVRLLAPFDNSWHSADLTGLIDFLILIVLSAALVLPKVLRAGTSARFPVRAALLCLGLVVAYFGLKVVCHERAVARLEALAPSGQAIHIACFPGSLSPFQWKGVIEKRECTELLDVYLSTRQPVLRQRFERICPEKLETAAMQSPEVRAQLTFARFPHFTAEPCTTASGRPGYKVHLMDLRWQSRKGYNYGPQVRLCFNEDLRIVKEEALPWS